jgi:membrane protein required for beta-lactamase induction
VWAVVVVPIASVKGYEWLAHHVTFGVLVVLFWVVIVVVCLQHVLSCYFRMSRKA